MNQRRKRNNPRKKHIIETDSECRLLYGNLLKNMKYWRGAGQYFISKEYENLFLKCDYNKKCINYF